uniref:Uncharacterized protein n=1 Tax=Timema bartmani TaxID=61472 RepID=A0A7R9I6G0_9NEOP|nr:unnamed protein product [Timema bartmani]
MVATFFNGRRNIVTLDNKPNQSPNTVSGLTWNTTSDSLVLSTDHAGRDCLYLASNQTRLLQSPCSYTDPCQVKKTGNQPHRDTIPASSKPPQTYRRQMETFLLEVVLHVSHSVLRSSDRMKPRSGVWAVMTEFLQEAAITSLSSGSSPLAQILIQTKQHEISFVFSQSSIPPSRSDLGSTYRPVVLHQRHEHVSHIRQHVRVQAEHARLYQIVDERLTIFLDDVPHQLLAQLMVFSFLETT